MLTVTLTMRENWVSEITLSGQQPDIQREVWAVLEAAYMSLCAWNHMQKIAVTSKGENYYMHYEVAQYCMLHSRAIMDAAVLWLEDNAEPGKLEIVREQVPRLKSEGADKWEM